MGTPLYTTMYHTEIHCLALGKVLCRSVFSFIVVKEKLQIKESVTPKCGRQCKTLDCDPSV